MGEVSSGPLLIFVKTANTDSNLLDRLRKQDIEKRGQFSIGGTHPVYVEVLYFGRLIEKRMIQEARFKCRKMAAHTICTLKLAEVLWSRWPLCRYQNRIKYYVDLAILNNEPNKVLNICMGSNVLWHSSCVDARALTNWYDYAWHNICIKATLSWVLKIWENCWYSVELRLDMLYFWW